MHAYEISRQWRPVDPRELSSRDLIGDVAADMYPPGQLLAYLREIRRRTRLEPMAEKHIAKGRTVVLAGYLRRRGVQREVMELVIELVIPDLPGDLRRLLARYLG
jgi:hypothetical protein